MLLIESIIKFLLNYDLYKKHHNKFIYDMIYKGSILLNHNMINR